MCVACVEPEAEVVGQVCLESPRVTWDDIERVREIQRELKREAYHRELHEGALVACRECGMVIRPADGDEAVMHRGWCLGCEASWIERHVLLPLVNSLGRKGARRALRRLAAGKKS